MVSLVSYYSFFNETNNTLKYYRYLNLTLIHSYSKDLFTIRFKSFVCSRCLHFEYAYYLFNHIFQFRIVIIALKNEMIAFLLLKSPFKIITFNYYLCFKSSEEFFMNEIYGKLNVSSKNVLKLWITIMFYHKCFAQIVFYFSVTEPEGRKITYTWNFSQHSRFWLLFLQYIVLGVLVFNSLRRVSVNINVLHSKKCINKIYVLNMWVKQQ